MRYSAAAEVETKVIGSSLGYHIKGPLLGVFAEIETIFHEYPAIAYGTTVRTLTAVTNSVTEYEANVTRALSCE